MLSPDELRRIGAEAVALTAQGKHIDAVELIERNLPAMGPDERRAVLPLLVAAANQGRFRLVTEKYCRELMTTDPDLPLVKEIRALWNF